jgi:hypothetical protein
MELGLPTFFLALMMIRYWADCETLNRGSGTAADSEISGIIAKTKLSVLMKFIECHETPGKISAFVWRIEHHKEAFETLISILLGMTLTRKTFLPWMYSLASDVQKTLHS